jgi:hypothetical protein
VAVAISGIGVNATAAASKLAVNLRDISTLLNLFGAETALVLSRVENVPCSVVFRDKVPGHICAGLLFLGISAGYGPNTALLWRLGRDWFSARSFGFRNATSLET